MNSLRAGLLGVCIAGAALGEESTTARFHTDPVEHWGSRFLIAVICVGIGLILASLFRYRGGHTGPVSWAILVVAVAIVPLASTGFGTILVFERAERVEFCASCHLTMQGFVDDMKNPKSDGLAAIHFKNRYIADNQCYVCHTSYGIFGTLEAKQSGMVDVFRYFTRTFSLPIKMRQPYPNFDCLKCHADSARWLKHDEHVAARDDLFADRVKCLDCHGAEHPAHIVASAPAGRS